MNSLAAVSGAAKAHPELRIDEAGDASVDKAQKEQSNEQAGRSLMLTLGLTLLILMFTFGAVVAAGIPVLLGLTSVLATVGLLGPVSQIAPVDGSVMEVVLLIGMAVGVDYSLFYLKREREERAAGRESNAAIEAAAATSGRAVLISGFTVMVAMGGMYLGGISNFASFATGTIMVVAVAMLGSLTVLPATLSKLGHRVEKGRVPFIGRLKDRGGVGIWSRVLDRVLRRPLISAVLAAGVLVALTVPVLGMQTSLEDSEQQVGPDGREDVRPDRGRLPERGQRRDGRRQGERRDLAEGRVGHQGSRVRGRRPSRSLRGHAERRAQPGQDGRHRGAPDHG